MRSIKCACTGPPGEVSQAGGPGIRQEGAVGTVAALADCAPVGLSAAVAR